VARRTPAPALAVLTASLLAGCAGAGRAGSGAAALYLEIGAPDGRVPYVRRAVHPGDTLRYRFVHSVSLTPVEEEWVVGGPGSPGLRLTAVRYRTTGAGLPSGPEEPGATFETTADGFVIRGLDRPIHLPLDLRVAPAAENSLTVGGETLDLTRFPARGGATASLVRLTLR
jgi:hypothetical protein